MINYIPRIYNDELFYSFVARCSEVAGNTNLKDIIQDFFGSLTLTPLMHFPCNISKFSSNVPEELGLNADYIISRHTMFPIYNPFLPDSRKKQVLKDMKFANGKRIGYLLGIQAGVLLNTKQLRYCPICVNEDNDLNGEAYFHRAHQADGILVCYKHGCKIKRYTFENDRFISRLKFISLNVKYINSDVEYYDKVKSPILLKISKAFFFLLENHWIQCDINNIYKRYKIILKEKGFLTISECIRQEEVANLFKKYFTDEILNILNCNFNIKDDSSWIRNISRNHDSIINPMKHILFVLFLCDSVELFFGCLKKKYEYFGGGPWPCLNPVSDHYRRKVIQKVKITADYKTRVPVGTFSCSCGFIYSRKGPDNLNEHIYKIGRIKQFGHVWEARLLTIAYEGNRSLRELSRMMWCDTNTIKKYINIIDHGSSNNLSNSAEVYNSKNISQNENLLKYRNTLIDIIAESPLLSRTEIRKNAQKEYTWLYRKDKDWLFEQMSQQNTGYVKINRNKVDWKERDKHILLIVTKAYNEIINNTKPIRITKSRLGSVAKVSSLIYNNKNKLPKTQEFIDEIIESIDKFQIRKANYIIKILLEQQGYTYKWQILKLVGKNPSNLVRFYIDEYLVAIK
ncbi:MAG TPA: TnsD family transposase [Clostridiaceae bacterium]